MSKKFGSDNFDKWDKQLNNWESSEYYYSQDDNENYVEDEDTENYGKEKN